MKTIETPAVITSISSRQDRSLRFSAETPEYTDEEFAEFRRLQGINVSIQIKPTDEETETLTIDTEMDGKTPSERLRGVLFVYWKQIASEKDPQLDFDTFYRRTLEKVIDQFKQKLL